jgi:hypothetical protein
VVKRAWERGRPARGEGGPSRRDNGDVNPAVWGWGRGMIQFNRRYATGALGGDVIRGLKPVPRR